MVWAVSFTVGAVILAAIVHAGGDVVVRTVVQVLGFVIPMAFTVRYVAIVKGRAQEVSG